MGARNHPRKGQLTYWTYGWRRPCRIRCARGSSNLLRGNAASPRELAAQLDAPLSTVAYHVRVPAGPVSLELVRLVGQEPRRGSVEHFYRALSN